jgi:hypothetical protein
LVAELKKLAHIKRAAGQEDSREFEFIVHENDYQFGDEGGQQNYEGPHGKRPNHLIADWRNSVFVAQPHMTGDIMIKNTGLPHHLRHHPMEQ